MAGVEKYTGGPAAYAPSAEGRKALSKVNIGGVVYDLKDAAARQVIDEIYADYLRSTDKSELLDAIAAKVSQTDYDAKVAELAAADEALGVRIAKFEAGGEHDVAALEGRVSTAEEAINVINGDEAKEGSIKKAIADEVANRNAAITSAIEALDVTDEAKDGEFVTAVSEVDGKITVTRAAFPVAAEYSLAKEKPTPEGLAARYYLTKNGDKVGADIDIAKDQFLKDAVFIASATQDDKDIDSTVVIGDPYIKFTFQTTGEDKITYVAVKDLVDVYTAGNGIDVTGNKISAVVKSGDKYIQVTADGIESKGIDAAISKAVADEAAIARAAEQANAAAITAEAERADAAEKANKAAIEAEATAARAAEAANAEAIKDEADRAKAAEKTNADAIAAEANRAKAAEEANAAAITAIKDSKSIDSFKDVEDALATKAAASDVTALAGRVTTAERDIGALESGKLDKTATVAGVAFTDNAISEESLKTALDLKALAHANTASGTATVASQTVKGVKATGTVAGEAELAMGYTSTSIDSTGSYTPAGNIETTISYTGTSATLETGEYTPAGNVSVTLSGNEFNTIASVGQLAQYTAEQVSGGIATRLDLSKFNGGTAASLAKGFVTAGSDASITAGSVEKGNDATSKFVKKAMNITVDRDDEEMLVISEVQPSDASFYGDAVTASGTITYTAPKLTGGKATVIDTSKFNGGSAASLDTGFYSVGTDVSYTASTYTAAVLPTIAAHTVGVATTGFTGTKVTNYVTGVKYDKANSAASSTFTGTAATLTVSGKYDKANKPTGSVTINDVSLDVGAITVPSQTISVTVSPDAVE